jgi:hypothetical protein
MKIAIRAVALVSERYMLMTQQKEKSSACLTR